MLRRGRRYIRFVGSLAGSPNNCVTAVSIGGLCFEHPMPGSLFISQQPVQLLDSLRSFWPQYGPEACPVHPSLPESLLSYFGFTLMPRRQLDVAAVAESSPRANSVRDQAP